MGVNPLLSSAITDVTIYQILAKPIISPPGSLSKVESVQLFASSSGVMAAQWSIACEQLASDLTRILGKASAAEVLECIHMGQILRLPGTYTSFELIRLGYRKSFVRAIGIKRKARVDRSPTFDGDG